MKFRGKTLNGRCGTEQAYLPDLIVRQFCSAVPFVCRHRAMTIFVISVFLASTPGQIRQAIIGRVAVEMAGLLTWWAWAAKCFQDKTMHVFRKIFAVFSQRDLFIGRTLSRDNCCFSTLKLTHILDPDFSKFGNKVPWEINARFIHAGNGCITGSLV